MSKSILNQTYSFPVLQSKHYLILFMVWPFLAFISALTNYNQKETRRVVYFFLIYYGLTFVIPNIGSDSEEYARRLKSFSELPFSDFFKMLRGLYSSDTSVDIVAPFIFFIVSRFTSQPNLLFATFAALFGFFYLKSINLLYDRYTEKPNWNAIILILFFLMVLPVTSINGFRMWTAAWIFFFGAYHVILYRDSRYFLITFGAVLVHFSFLSVNAILVIYFLAGNRNVIYIPLAVASFIVPQLLAPMFQKLSLGIGGGLQSRYEMYSNEEYAIGRQESIDQAIWFVKISDLLILYYLVFALIFIQLRYRSVMSEKYEKNLFSFLLLFLSFVNFAKVIPSFGGRFQVLFVLFATLYLLLFFLKNSGGNIKPLLILGFFPMLLTAALEFRNGTDSINAWILAPGFGLPLLLPDLSLADFLFN